MPNDDANAMIDVGDRTSLDLLVDEANRQLSVCNSCRYCEGFCAVFPALERRTLLGDGDISQLANLCHDCRACFDACMYTTPHEFEINPPKVLAEVRLQDYRRFVWPRTVPALLRGWTGVFAGVVVAVVLVVLLALINVGPAGLVATDSGPMSPYLLLPFPELLVLLLVPAVFSVVVMADAGRRYWRAVGGAPNGMRMGAVGRAVWYAATLRYLRGGGADCYYPEETSPSPVRRNLHALVAYGFGLCLLSTVAAAVLQDIVGSQPPYPLLSVPVISGTIGGIGLVIGCFGLLSLKARAAQVTSVAKMTIKDYGLLVALAFLALSGLATLLTRSTPAFGIVFLTHLAAIMLTFGAAPYSKFVHLVYRFLAIVRDNLEREAA